MHWVREVFNLQDKVKIWSQQTNYDLLNRDLIVRNANILFKNFRKSKSVFKALISTFKWEFLQALILTFMFCMFNLFTAFLTAQIVGMIVAKEGKFVNSDLQELITYFATLLLVLFFEAVLQAQANFKNQRMSYLAKNCLNFLLFQKVLNFDVLNGSFSEGKIVNMIQVDCSKFEMMFQKLGSLI